MTGFKPLSESGFFDFYAGFFYPLYPHFPQYKLCLDLPFSAYLQFKKTVLYCVRIRNSTCSFRQFFCKIIRRPLRFCRWSARLSESSGCMSGVNVMSSFKLQQDGFTSYTCVANSFIERYMPKAAGEFVKIYIYLLKCVEENTSELSISRIADAFENTQKDVVRALKYWEKKGLLKLSFDGEILTSLKIISLPDVEEELPEAEPASDRAFVNVKPALFTKRQYSKEETAALLENEDVSQLVYIVQKYLGRTLTSADVNSILFFYDGLKLPVDVIEYLFEYCVSKEKTAMRYIEKTAITWSEKEICTVKAAKALNAIRSGNTYPVMKAFGLSGRQPAKKETEFIEKWTLSYGFDMGIIVEACERTINTIHQPSFEYADSILRNWHTKQVVSLEDIQALDAEYAGKASSSKKNAGEGLTKSVKNRIANFTQRDNDYAQLEKVIFNK